MRNLNVFICILGFFILTAVSCKKEKMKVLEGSKWKLQGFYDSRNQKLEQPKPDNCSECYVIKFGDIDWKGRSSTNVLFGHYIVDLQKRTLKFTDINSTEINELYDGHKYMLILKSVFSFELKENQLKLLYDTQGDYLIFDKF